MHQVRTKGSRASYRPRSKELAAGASCLALALACATPGLAQVSERPTSSAPSATPTTSAPVEQAASPGGAPTPPGNDAQLGDIVVTARRVQERLQDIPASVSAITADQVARMDSLADIQSMVSGVTFKSFGPIPTVGIRGFGNRTIAGSTVNSTVGIFDDGVFVAPPLVTLINRVDSGRVEVAKGPQSTLYGRSSFTGAINIVSNDPAKVFSGDLDAGYGGSSVHGETLYHVRGDVSVPVGDKFQVRVFGLHEERDGYVYDPVTGNRGLGYDRTIGRVRLMWEPTDDLTIRLTGTIMRDNLPQGPVETGRVPPPLGQGILFANPANPATRNALVFSPNVWSGVYDLPQSGKTRGEQGTLDIRYKTPIGELASLTDYQHSNQNIRTSLDLTRLSLAEGDTLFDEDRYSEELRLSNKLGRFNYLGGLYYLHTTARQGGGTTIDRAHPFSTFGPGTTLYDFAGVNAIYQPQYTATDAYAAFGQLGYDFTDQLNLTVGLRQSRDELSGPSGTFLQTRTGVLIPSVPYTARKGNFNATTGSANLSYKIAPDIVTYASYSRGNSPGGLNIGAGAFRNYGPQKVDAYELGVKSQLLNRRLQINVALFDNQYKDLQITQNSIINGALTSLVNNAGNARGRGADIDAVAVLSREFRVGVQYTYVDSRITHYIVPAAPAPQVDFTGSPLVRSPEHSVNGSITYTKNIGPGKLLFTAEESYSSSYTNDYQGAAAGTVYPGRPGIIAPGKTTSQVLALYRTPGYALTNLNASYTVGPYEVSGFVRNLFNHQYIAALVAFDAVTYPEETPGEPRTFEVSVKYHF